MGHRAEDQVDNRVAGAISSLHGFFDSEPEANDALAEIEARCAATGAELLFELPADHPSLGESRWTVLRFVEEDEERFVHVFFGAADHGYWIGQESDAPREFASFARAWTDVLTSCAAGLETFAPPLYATS